MYQIGCVFSLNMIFSPQYWAPAGTSSNEKVVLHVQRWEMEPSIENIMNLFFFCPPKQDCWATDCPFWWCSLWGCETFTGRLGMAICCYWGLFAIHPFWENYSLACRLVHLKTSVRDLLFFSQLLFLKALTLIWPLTSRISFSTIQFPLHLPFLPCRSQLFIFCYMTQSTKLGIILLVLCCSYKVLVMVFWSS